MLPLTLLVGIIIGVSLIPIKDCEYKGEHPNRKPSSETLNREISGLPLAGFKKMSFRTFLGGLRTTLLRFRFRLSKP